MKNLQKGLCILFLLCWGAYAIYTSFFQQKKYRIEKFGLNYNEFRNKNNIPLLPSNWILDDKRKYGIDNFHSPNMEQLGHRIKYVNTLKSDVGAEMDKFYLTQDSILETRYERNTGHKFLYLHNISTANNKLITNIEANLILKKYGINYVFNDSWNHE